MSRRIAYALIGALVALSVAYRPAVAGWSSLWTDDATLVQQLVELMEIRREMEIVSEGVLVTAQATREIAQTVQQSRALVQDIQDYGPGDFWRDFQADTYKHYPGLGLLGRGEAWRWKDSVHRSPVKVYELIGAAFADTSGALRARHARGEIDLTYVDMEWTETAGAMSESNDIAAMADEYDKHVRELELELGKVRDGDPSTLISAKASLAIASQNSRTLKLLARMVRMQSFDRGMKLRAKVDAMNRAEKAGQNLSATFGKGSSVQARTSKPLLIDFSTLW